MGIHKNCVTCEEGGFGVSFVEMLRKKRPLALSFYDEALQYCIAESDGTVEGLNSFLPVYIRDSYEARGRYFEIAFKSNCVLDFHLYQSLVMLHAAILDDYVFKIDEVEGAFGCFVRDVLVDVFKHDDQHEAGYLCLNKMCEYASANNIDNSAVEHAELALIAQRWREISYLLSVPADGLRLADGSKLRFSNYKELEIYWTHALPVISKNHFVDFKDIRPVCELEVKNSLHLYSNVNIKESQESCKQLISEARANKNASIPHGAVVEINLPPFTHVQLFEDSYGVVDFLWFTSKGRFAHLEIVPFKNDTFAICVSVMRIELDAGFAANFSTVMGTMAVAIIRDFWVVEEREKVLGPPRYKQFKYGKKQLRKVVYLPRVKYIGIHSTNLTKQLSYQERRAHFVADHFRKLPETHKPSLEQLELARVFSRVVPEGHTWIKGHERGTGDGDVTYRSKSATGILFDITPVKAKPNSSITPFDFERLCKQFVEKCGYTVTKSGTSGADGGVDVHAFSIRNGKPFRIVVQCKHWVAPVDVCVIREMVGVREKEKSHEAWVIASGRFTKAAIGEADILGIRCIDGVEFDWA